MAVVEQPIAELRIQRSEVATADPSENAVVFSMPDEVYFEATVEYEASDEGTVGTLTANVYNATVEDLLSFHPDAVVQLEGGYGKIVEEEGIVSASKALLFFGYLDYAYPYQAGGEIVLRIVASTNPEKIQNLFVPYSTPPGQPIPAAEVMQKIASHIGATVLFPESIRDVQLVDYTTKNSLITELNGLVNGISEATGRTHSLIPAPESGGFAFALVDLTDPEVERLSLDLDEDSVMTAQFGISRAPKQSTLKPAAATNIPDPEGLLGGAVDEEDEGAGVVEGSFVLEFSITMAFDPRVRLAMGIDAVGEIEGKVFVQALSIRHEIGGEWTTKVSGPAFGGNVVGL